MLDISNDEIIKNIKNISDKYQEVMLHLIQGKGNIIPLSLVDPNKMNTTLSNIYEQFLADPQKFLQINIEYAEKLNSLVASSIRKFTGQEGMNPMFIPSNKDKRFKDSAWQDNIYFDFVKQFYLMSTEFVQKNIEQYDLQPELKQYLDFITRQFIDALAPSNFIYSNPEVLKEILDSGFSNIVKGLDNFLDDIKMSGDILNIQTTDKSAFRLGENIAATEGKVIFQNDLMQLICYKPNDTAYSIPLLVIPPWINKYYILDLSPNNSMISFLVKNNFQVFVVSWVNPDKDLADKNFEDYLREGFLEPSEYITKLGYEKINVLGYCIGGTLLASGLAYLKTNNINYVNSASFITTLLDFRNPGEVGVFINESSIAAIEKEMELKGYFDGKYLSNIFSLLRANDLVWSFFVNNYLLGKNPMPFDLLYWNSDSTNLPYKMHSYYLRNMYLDNLLKIPNGLQLLGVPIDLTTIDCKSFFVAANEDHIAPWKSVYDGSKLIKSDDKVFCLTSSGHVAGIINPPTSLKNNYRICDDLSLNSEEWLLNSSEHNGSWWLYWQKWLESDNNILVKSMNYDKLDFIEHAPGSYVKQSR
jgi:polyhydroxyalkanoate synthase